MTETKNCKNCNQQFEITEADLAFYQKMTAVAPVYCPTCRAMRRIAWRNERTLYKRKCDLCKKDMVATYPEGTPWPVYCNPCWWGDGWDPKSFGLTYDSARPFWDQFKELMHKVPRIGLLVITSVNSEYCNNSADLKNCYLLFASEKCEDSMYGRLVQTCKSAVDTCFVYDSELCYECTDCVKCFNVLFCKRCQTSSDLLFCFDVRDSNHCILSTNLRHQSCMIENKQCMKEEYEQKKKEILASAESIAAAKKRFEELKAKTLVKFAYQTKCVNATGDYLYNCFESKNLFDTRNAKDCAHLADAEDPVQCFDLNNAYYKPENCLDIMGALQSNNCKHDNFVFYSNELEYCDNCHNSQSLFGCIGLKKTKYCILNKSYTKEEYQKIKARIIELLKKEGSYGNFLPPAFAPFGYNETLAADMYPLSKEQAAQSGFWWQEKGGRTSGRETIKKGEIPKTLEGVTDAITKEVLVCETCDHNYKITPAELQFYRKMHLPLPQQDYDCRHRARMAGRTPRQLWAGECQCAGMVSKGMAYKNKGQHFHRDSTCPNKFQTAYSPDRKEVVYCEQCYQAEVI